MTPINRPLNQINYAHINRKPKGRSGKKYAHPATRQLPDPTTRTTGYGARYGLSAITFRQSRESKDSGKRAAVRNCTRRPWPFSGNATEVGEITKRDRIDRPAR